jgi:ankyrin repeat protein
MAEHMARRPSQDQPDKGPDHQQQGQQQGQQQQGQQKGQQQGQQQDRQDQKQQDQQDQQDQQGPPPRAAQLNRAELLRSAALDGRSEAVMRLLVGGVAVDAADQDGWTALHNTASQGHEHVARALLQAKANIHATTAVCTCIGADSNTPIIPAFANEKPSLASANVRAHGQPSLCCILQDSTTPLHLAALNGHVGMVRLLLDKGADANAADLVGLRSGG